MKKHFGWTVWGILGLVFVPISLVFIPVGIVVNAAKPGKDGQAILYVFCTIGSAPRFRHRSANRGIFHIKRRIV